VCLPRCIAAVGPLRCRSCKQSLRRQDALDGQEGRTKLSLATRAQPGPSGRVQGSTASPRHESVALHSARQALPAQPLHLASTKLRCSAGLTGAHSSLRPPMYKQKPLGRVQGSTVSPRRMSPALHSRGQVLHLKLSLWSPSCSRHPGGAQDRSGQACGRTAADEVPTLPLRACLLAPWLSSAATSPPCTGLCGRNEEFGARQAAQRRARCDFRPTYRDRCAPMEVGRPLIRLSGVRSGLARALSSPSAAPPTFCVCTFTFDFDG